jgi:hypothetical protein
MVSNSIYSDQHQIIHTLSLIQSLGWYWVGLSEKYPSGHLLLKKFKL